MSSVVIPNEADAPAFPGVERNVFDMKGGQTPTEYPKEKVEETLALNMEGVGEKGKNGCASIEISELLVLPEEPSLEVKHEHYGNVPPPGLPGTPVVTQTGDQKVEDPSPSSTASPSSYPSHPPPAHSPHGQHQSHPPTHPSYAHYYQHYPHGHAHYYYPHGAYYPPPPHHSGHQSYHHASHHAHAHAAYYAHYPPPGYYPPPHHYYYPQAHSKGAKNKGSEGESAQRSTPSPPQSKGPSASTPVPPQRSSKPYSAFSSPPKVSAPANSPPAVIPAKATPATSQAPPKSNNTKSQSGQSANRSKRKATEPTTIFRNNEKRTKQSSSNLRATAAAIAAKQAQKKEEERQELPKTVLDRRSRKNAQSRMRAAKLKRRITSIQAKDPKDRTEDEIAALSVFEERRQRKNGRSRERALERKREYERIMKVSEEKWTETQKAFVQETMVAKFKKNEGDRLRRKKLKDEFDGSTCTGSVSSEWENSTCRGSFSSSTKKQPEAPKKSGNSTSKAGGIPDYIESTNIGYEEPPSQGTSDSRLREAPCTPVSQKEVNSLLESTPTNFFGVYSPDRNKGDCFSPNFIFPSPSNHRDLSSTMDSIDFDSLELPTDGTSILDSSMAINIDDEVMYSPHLKTPTINNSNANGHHKLRPTDQHAIPNLSSKITLSPLSIRRNRGSLGISKRAEHETGLSNCTETSDLHDMSFPEELNSGRSTADSKAIAVSFSIDTI